MKNSSKIISIFFVVILILTIIFTSLFINLHHISIIIFLISILLSLIIFIIFEKQYNNLSRKIRFLIILTTLFFMGIFMETWHMFMTYPTIAITKNYVKAEAIRKYVEKNHFAFVEINDFNDKQILSIHTYSHKRFDKIAISIADSDLFDDSVKIGVYYNPSDNLSINKGRLEKCFNNRIKLIKGVKDSKITVNLYEKNNIPNPDLTTIKIDVVIEKNADKDRIYKIINNFLPLENNKKTINITSL